MRIERRGDRQHVGLESIFRLLLVEDLDTVVKAFQKLRPDIFSLLARILHAQVLILQLLAPQVAKRRLIGWPRSCLAAFEFKRLGGSKIEFRRLKRAFHVGHLLPRPFQELIVDGEPSRRIAGNEVVIEMNASLLPHFLDLGSREVAAVVVEIVEVTVENLLGERVVDRHLAIVVLKQILGQVSARLLLRWRRLEHYRLRCLTGGGHGILP